MSDHEDTADLADLGDPSDVRAIRHGSLFSHDVFATIGLGVIPAAFKTDMVGVGHWYPPFPNTA